MNICDSIHADVTEQGITIPKNWFEGIKKVEIRKKKNSIVIIPTEKNDPIMRLGKHPVSCGIKDGSINHDNYLY